MWLPSRKQVDTATRYAGVVAGTAFTIFGLQAKGFDLQQAQTFITQLGDTLNTVVTLIGAGAVLYGSIRGVNAASPTNQIASVNEIAADPSKADSDSAKIALLNATGAVLAQPYAGNGAMTIASQETKTALLDATAAMPEVVGTIEVTDPALVQSTVSNQVVKTGGMPN